MKKKNHVAPECTYMSWDGHFTIADRKLVCIYTREKSLKWTNFERDYLITHPMLDYCIPVDDERIVYVFDLNSVMEDYDRIVAGKYSTLSADARKKIADYYGTHTPEWVYIESYLYPKKYFQHYSELLGIDVEILQEVGELCEIYDEIEEHCTERASSELPQ
jgi:hypothetical protein